MLLYETVSNGLAVICSVLKLNVRTNIVLCKCSFTSKTLCTDSVKNFYIVIQSQNDMYDKFINLNNNHLSKIFYTVSA